MSEQKSPTYRLKYLLIPIFLLACTDSGMNFVSDTDETYTYSPATYPPPVNNQEISPITQTGMANSSIPPADARQPNDDSTDRPSGTTSDDDRIVPVNGRIVDRATDTSLDTDPLERVNDPRDGPAYLHADLWLRWANGRTRCGALAKFWWMCEQMNCSNKSEYERSYRSCNPFDIVYGQVGPEKEYAEDTCGRGPFGTCDIKSTFGDPPDFEKAHFYWEGCTWNGGWAGAALLVFDPPLASAQEAETRGLSSAKIIKTSAPGEEDYHGLENKGDGCVMVNKHPNDDKVDVYDKPWGGFAFVPLEPGKEVSILVCAGSGCGGKLFNPSGRQENMDPPVKLLTLHTFTPGLGRHYYIGLHNDGAYDTLTDPKPPDHLVDGFTKAGIDIADGDGCH